MAQRVLAVGWGDVSGRYWPVLEKLVANGRIELTIAEVRSKAPRYPARFMEWEDPELARQLMSGEHDLILVLASPSAHFEILDRCLPEATNCQTECRIAVEKPLALDVGEAERICQIISDRSAHTACAVAVADHYTLKPAIRYVRREATSIARRIGRLKQVVFVSAERKLLHQSDAFRRGYAREHAVHAFAVLDSCIPHSGPLDVFASQEVQSQTWRYEGLPEDVGGDSAFVLKCWVAGDLEEFGASRFRLWIVGGKGLDRDEKCLILHGSSGSLSVLYNDHLVDLHTGTGAVHRLYERDASSERTAYEHLLEHALSPQLFGQVTRSVQDAARDVERVGRVLQTASSSGTYEPGTSPFKGMIPRLLQEWK